ncbi:MAG: DUF1449 family protein [Candidatus Electrothrix sp. AR3]|nr:DUF1449 family protein [Candidatus Electrothrix sp. AR3]
MFIFLAEPHNLPFAAALAVMVLIVFLETISVLLGAGFSDLLDALVPELDTDIDLVDSSPSTLTQVLSWFRVGEVPILMLLLVALTVFGLAGIGLQFAMQTITGQLLQPLTASIPAGFISLSLVRVLGGFLGKYMPGDETWAVSEQSLLGKSATIIAGTARLGNPVQAKVQDEHQQTHYVMVEPDNDAEIFIAGENVMLLRQEGAIFKAVRG